MPSLNPRGLDPAACCHDIVSQPARERQRRQLLRTINNAAKIRFDVRNTRLQRLSVVERPVWIAVRRT